MPIRRLDGDGMNQALNRTGGKSKDKIQRLFWELLRQRLHSSTIGPSGNTTMKTEYDLFLSTQYLLLLESLVKSSVRASNKPLILKPPTSKA